MNEYKGKIKFIYIDPPYGSGCKKGKCRVLYNNFNERDILIDFLRERIKMINGREVNQERFWGCLVLF